MVTVVNNPTPSNESDGGMGMIVGVIVLLVVIYLFFMYGLPAIRQMGTPQINIPSKIDVNVNQTK
ncbi:MAG: hypothetical protein WC744_03395 [Patescibacteria group bacterium]|jgi:hypothetical protein